MSLSFLIGKEANLSKYEIVRWLVGWRLGGSVVDKWPRKDPYWEVTMGSMEGRVLPEDSVNTEARLTGGAGKRAGPGKESMS